MQLTSLIERDDDSIIERIVADYVSMPDDTSIAISTKTKYDTTYTAQDLIVDEDKMSVRTKNNIPKISSLQVKPGNNNKRKRLAKNRKSRTYMIEKNTQSNTEELKHRRGGGAFDMLARIFRNVISIIFSSGAVIEDRMGGGEGSLVKADSVFQIYHKNKPKKDAYNFIYLGREGKVHTGKQTILVFRQTKIQIKSLMKTIKQTGTSLFPCQKMGRWFQVE